MSPAQTRCLLQILSSFAGPPRLEIHSSSVSRIPPVPTFRRWQRAFRQLLWGFLPSSFGVFPSINTTSVADSCCLPRLWFLRTRSILPWPRSDHLYHPTHENRSRAHSADVRRGEVCLCVESFHTSCIEACCFHDDSEKSILDKIFMTKNKFTLVQSHSRLLSAYLVCSPPTALEVIHRGTIYFLPFFNGSRS